jgi:uncharacterized membrane protein YdbT with pleckstrin-like domain
MGFIERNLTSGEELIFKTKLHWWVVIGAFFNTFVATLILFACFLSFSTSGSGLTTRPNQPSATSTAMWTCAGSLAILAGIAALIYRNTSEFGVTDRRVIMKTGLVLRRTLELSLPKVESIEARETLLGRMFGFKTLLLIGSGGTKHRFPLVAEADEFKDRLIEAIDGNETRSTRQFSGRTRPKSKNTISAFDDDEYELPSETEVLQQQIQRVLALIRTGDRATAKGKVRSLVNDYPESADVWYLAGYLSVKPEDKKRAYRRALQLNPNHNKAREALAAIGDDGGN